MSKRYCCVPGCPESGDMHPVLHVFPNPGKDLDRFRSWVLAIGGEILGLDNNWIYKNRRVCHHHFENQHCYYSNKLNRLAIPTKKLPGPTIISKFTFSGKRSMSDKENIPSTSKASCGIFDMDIDDEPQNILQSSASIAKKSDTIDLFRPTEDRNCMINISDISVQPSTCIQYLSVPVLGSSNLDNIISTSTQGLSTVAQQSVAKTVPVLGSSNSDNIISTSTQGLSAVAQLSVAKTVKRKLRSSPITKSEQALFKRLRLLQIRLSRCKNQKKKYANSVKIAQNIMTNQSFLYVLENMTPAGRTLTLLQFREHKKKGKGRRFTLKEKIMALSIYKQSPKAYRTFRKYLLMPATQTLDKMVQKAIIAPKYDERVFKQLKEKALKMKASDKLSVLLFDEVSLQASINYDITEDKINGIVDDICPTKFVNHALVFMLRGLIKNFKQPLAYMFCNGATDAITLKKYIVDIIKKVEEAGFRIVATVCDQGSNNQKAIKSLVDDNRKEKLRNGEELRQNSFVVNNSEIVPLYDPPHLLKGIRNNLLSKKLIYTNEFGKECTAKWEHLEMLYAENPAYKGLRLVPKLTEQHVIKEKIGKMKVKFASQIFSQTVGRTMGYLAEKGILSAECRDTADLLIIFDNLFDSMNGSHSKKEEHGKPYLGAVTATSMHNKLWSQTKRILNSMKFVDNSGKSKTTPTLQNFIWTIEGLQYLVKQLTKFDITSFWPRHLNQDPLENFFGSIRSHGYRNNNPSPAAFRSAYTALLINNLSSVHAAGSNCENDFCESLEAFVINPGINTNKHVQNINIDHLLISAIPLEEKKKNVKEIASLTYVSGFLLKICKKRIFKKCEKCNSDLFDQRKENEYLKHREYSGRGWLCYPSDDFVHVISQIQDIFDKLIKEIYTNNNILQYMKLVIDFTIDNHKIAGCETHKNRLIFFLYNYTLRFFVRNYCKDINKILLGRRKKDNVNDDLQNKAETYYIKCLKNKNK